MVCTNGTSGSAEMCPGGRSVGSTELGKDGGEVMPSSTSWTWEREGRF